jgi:hypothetical protein
MSYCFASAKPMAKSDLTVTMPLPLLIESQVTSHTSSTIRWVTANGLQESAWPTSAGLPRIHRSSVLSVSIRWATVDALTASLEGLHQLGYRQRLDWRACIRWVTANAFKANDLITSTSMHRVAKDGAIKIAARHSPHGVW